MFAVFNFVIRFSIITIMVKAVVSRLISTLSYGINNAYTHTHYDFY